MNARIHLCRVKFVFLVCLIALSQRAGSTSENAAGSSVTLVAGAKLSEVISAGETRVYKLSVLAGQHARIELQRQDLQLSIAFCDAEGESCRQLIARRYGALDLSFSAQLSATYTIEIKSLEQEKGERQYEIHLFEIAATTRNDRLADKAREITGEAEQLRELQDEPSQLAAVRKYSEANQLWQAVDQPSRAVETLCNMGEIYFVLSQYQLSLTQYETALSMSERNGDKLGTLAALNGIAYAHVYLGANDKALSYATQVLDRVKGSGEFKRAEAQALNTIGEIDYAEGELRKSIEMFERAYSLYAEIGERTGQALALLNLGYSHSDLGDAQKAAENYEQALVQFQSVSNAHGSTLAQTALGGFYSLLGEEDKALSLHKAASDYFRRMGNKQGEASALNGIARAYQNLNDYDSALDNYNKALRLYEAIGHRGNTALNEFLVARVLYQKGETEQAKRFYGESLKLSREAGDPLVEAHALKGLGTIHFRQGNVTAALEQYGAALQVYRARGNRRSEAYVLNDIAHIQIHSRNAGAALAGLQEALPLMRATGDRHGEALTLFNTAKGELARGDLTAALSSIEDSIAIGESLRTKTNNSQLRTSFFASVDEQYKLYIDILMSLHAQHPNQGYAVAALLASERGRARSLLDSLVAEKIESRDTPAAELMAQVQTVLQTLNEKAEYQTRLLGGKHTREEVDKLSEEIRELTIQYQDIRSKLRVQSPQRATLIQPDQLKAEDLQSLVKGDDALLLEFGLGEDRSYLWVVSSSAISSYELPARAKIEALAGKVYESITMRQSAGAELTEQEKLINEADASYQQQSLLLSNMLLGPVASRLAAKRILIVGDGLLHFIPFDALPLPDGAPTQSGDRQQLLVSAYDVVTLPSALTLVALRAAQSSAASRSKTINIIADPVFERDDPRVTGQAAAANQDANAYFSSALRGFNQEKSGHVSRLPSTLRETRVISDLVPVNQAVITTGFAATKQRFISESVRDYRILHIATHGLLNVEHPNLSGLIFSLLDEQGKSIDGFLRLHDLYNLDVPVDLVVLSACRTGLGKDIGGEGVISLSSGFMYAGAKTVISSLWKVDDNATAEFMSHFYRALLKESLPADVALRNAKLEMQKEERWRAPFYWAGFVLQGEYRQSLVDQETTGRRQLIVIIVAISVGMGSIYAIKRYKTKVPNSNLR